MKFFQRLCSAKPSVYCKIMLSSTLLMLAVSANANLLINGDFESVDVPEGGWRWYASDDVEGWSGSTIEVWQNHRGVSAYSGNRFAELNAHANGGQQFVIFQSVQTQIDQLYEVSFAYRARINNNEMFRIEVTSNNTLVYSQLLSDHSVSSWSNFSNKFTAIGTETMITFTSIVPESSTVGNFLDDITLVQSSNNNPNPPSPPGPPITPVAAPSIMAIIVLSGLALIFYRRKVKYN